MDNLLDSLLAAAGQNPDEIWGEKQGLPAPAAAWIAFGLILVISAAGIAISAVM